MSDRLVRAISRDGLVKAAAVSTRELTERARQIHKTLPVATAALGRTLAAASMLGFLSRAFFTDHCAGLNRFAFKPGAALVSARRAGTTAALDELNKYLLYAQMPIVTSRYWNMVHGQTPEEVQKDLEGMQIMRVLGRNMAWLLWSIEAGQKAGIAIPEQEPRISTNFIR